MSRIEGDAGKKRPILRENYLAVTVLVVLVVAALFLSAYFRIAAVLEERSRGRMEESVNTAIEEVAARLRRDSARLNAIADILGGQDALDPESVAGTLRIFQGLFETSKVRLLLPDNTIIKSDGDVVDGTGSVDFAREAPLGEHVSDRMRSAEEDNTLVIRQFVPIVQNGETVALVYGATDLDKLPSTLNISHLYNGKAGVYIIDTVSGDYLMDTVHGELGTADSFAGEIDGSESWEDVVRAIRSGRTGQTTYREAGADEWSYMYYAPCGINQWTIAVTVPRSESFLAVYAVRRIWTEIAGILALVLVLYFMFVRHNARQTMKRAVEQAVLQEKLQKAEAAERAKTAFLSNMSHDIRTPMNAIIGFTTLARNHPEDTERVREHLDKIMSASNHLLSLINDVLDMSRIEAGKLRIEPQPCCLSGIAEEIRGLIQGEMDAKQLTFTVDAADVTDDFVWCDKLHINQVLLNLLGNAVKFTPQGGAVAMTVRQEPGAPEGFGAYEISVKDTGIGMSPEFAEHVFEPFERERTSTVSGIQGTGLGMAITKSIVDAMDGEITVHTKQNEGTEFVIRLRLRLQTEAERAAAPAGEETSLSGGAAPSEAGVRLLLVEDNELNREIAQELLTEAGFLVDAAGDGTEAVDKVRSSAPGYYTLVLMDIQMPTMNGYDAARAIRALEDRRLAGIPIIAMTANAFEEDRRLALEAGMNDHLTKPIDAVRLMDTLHRVLEQTTEGIESEG